MGPATGVEHSASVPSASRKTTGVLSSGVPSRSVKRQLAAFCSAPAQGDNVPPALQRLRRSTRVLGVCARCAACRRGPSGTGRAGRGRTPGSRCAERARSAARLQHRWRRGVRLLLLAFSCLLGQFSVSAARSCERPPRTRTHPCIRAPLTARRPARAAERARAWKAAIGLRPVEVPSGCWRTQLRGDRPAVRGRRRRRRLTSATSRRPKSDFRRSGRTRPRLRAPSARRTRASAIGGRRHCSGSRWTCWRSGCTPTRGSAATAGRRRSRGVRGARWL